MCTLFEEMEREAELRGGKRAAIANKVELIVKKLNKNKNLEVIAEELEEDIVAVKELVEIVLKFAPEYDVETITKEIMIKNGIKS